jgi:hypothetical protein
MAVRWQQAWTTTISLPRGMRSMPSRVRAGSSPSSFASIRSSATSATIKAKCAPTGRPSCSISSRRTCSGRYSGRARTAVRKALNDGLALRWEAADDAKAVFPSFYRDGMRQIGASDFYLFSDEYFAAMLELPASRVLSVTRDGTRLAMGMFLFGPDVAEYHLSAASAEGRSSNATNLLLHGAADSARQAGLRSLYLGGGTTSAADKPAAVVQDVVCAGQLDVLDRLAHPRSGRVRPAPVGAPRAGAVVAPHPLLPN